MPEPEESLCTPGATTTLMPVVTVASMAGFEVEVGARRGLEEDESPAVAAAIVAGGEDGLACTMAAEGDTEESS